MAANVETMLYVGETPWHGLGTKVDSAPTSAEAIKLAGLDWTVEQSPIMVNGAEVEGYLANVRNTDGKILGITSDKYKPVQNSEAFDFTDELIGAGCKYETAGSLKEGKLIWLLALTDSRKILGDEIQQYLTFATGHDGKTPVKVFDTSTRVVCSNTYQIALKGAKRVWSFEHQSGVHDRIREFTITMANARNYMDNLETYAQKLFEQKISQKKLEKILTQVFGDESEFADQPVKVKRIQALKSRLNGVYESKDDLQNFRGTAWGLYNAASDVACHATPTFITDDAKERRFLSFIDGNKFLLEFQKAIELVA